MQRQPGGPHLTLTKFLGCVDASATDVAASATTAAFVIDVANAAAAIPTRFPSNCGPDHTGGGWCVSEGWLVGWLVD